LACYAAARYPPPFPTRRSSDLDAAVRAAPSRLDFARNTAGDVVASQQLRRTPRLPVAAHVAPAFLGVVGGLVLVEIRDVVEHESDRKSTRLNSSHVKISYAVFC